MKKVGLVLVTVSVVALAVSLLAARGNREARTHARGNAERRLAVERSGSQSLSLGKEAASRGRGAVGAPQTQSDPAVLRAGGADFRLEPASVSPKVDQATVLATAHSRVSALSTQVLSVPTARHWLVTDPGREDPTAATYMQRRPMWIVTYDRVVSLVRGPASIGQPTRSLPATDEARVHVLLDSQTGAIITVTGDGLRPITSPEPHPEVCETVAC